MPFVIGQLLKMEFPTSVSNLRASLKALIPQLFHSWLDLSGAADAHLAGDRTSADALLRQADRGTLWDWLNPEWAGSPRNVVEQRPSGDTRPVPKAMRDPVRHLTTETKAFVLARDGHRCRYCGSPVISADIRKLLHKLYPDSVPWDRHDPRQRHQGLQALWLQFDHVVPHYHGGRSDPANIVVFCALCNYGKDRFTLRQLHLSDPRDREPVPVDWDGLERLRPLIGTGSVARPQTPQISVTLEKAISATGDARRHAFFLPGGWIGKGYVFTPPLLGKERWFKLGPDVIAGEAIRKGVAGCLVDCAPEKLVSRGLPPEEFLDPGPD